MKKKKTHSHIGTQTGSKSNTIHNRIKSITILKAENPPERRVVEVPG